MKIIRVQSYPVEIFEVQDYVGVGNFNDILEFLFDSNLPERLELSFQGNRFSFRSGIERIQFAHGFAKAYELIWGAKDGQ